MQDLRDKYIAAIADATDESALEALRVAAVGRAGVGVGVGKQYGR